LLENRASLNWSVASQGGLAHYIIERSADGHSFKTIGTVPGKNTAAGSVQAYTFTDSTALSGKAWYRIILVDGNNNRQFSNSILLESAATDFMITGVINPFSSRLNFNLTAARTASTEVTLASLSGSIIKRQVFTASKGVNAFTLNDLHGLPSGVYLLEVKYMDRKFLTKVIKNE
jgi:hypothetical protein